MATRTTLTKSSLPGPYNYTGVTVTFAAADVANKNRFVLTGKEVVLAWNTAAVASGTVTITATADPYGRTQSITGITLDAGEMFVFGPFTNRQGWLQTDGYLYLEASAVEVKFAVLVIP